MRIEHTTRIDATVARVWELTVDIDGLPAVTPTVTRATRLDDGPLGVDSQVELTQPGQRPKVWTVTDLTEPTRFVWEAEFLGQQMAGIHELTPRGSATLNTVAVEFDDSVVGRSIGALMWLPIRMSLARENAGFKRSAETD